MNAHRRGAFTLIELLIVVAIIAILALIAVPNFLEAQVRAKVSRVKADMRTVAVAWDSYHVDWNCYPEDQDDFLTKPGEFGYRQVTTPIAYIASIPYDPFNYRPTLPGGTPGVASYFEIASAVATEEPYDCYCICSFGPDHIMNTGIGDAWPASGAFLAYDPTNGTVSAGEILRFGGQYLVGSWDFCGVPYRQWGAVPMVP